MTLVAAVLGGAAVVVSNGDDGMVREMVLSVIIGSVCMAAAAVAAKLIESVLKGEK